MAKSGIKTWTMLSSLVLGLVFVTGCNSDDTSATDSAPKAGGGGAAVKPSDAKPGPGPAPTKPDDKK
jgi:hypothetical protein